MKHAIFSLCLLFLLAAIGGALSLQDADGIVYGIGPDGSGSISGSGAEKMIPLPPFVWPTFRTEPDGGILAALQTAMGVNIIKLRPSINTWKSLEILRGASSPLLAAGGLFYIMDDGVHQTLFYKRTPPSGHAIARFDEIGGYAAIKRNGRIVIALGASEGNTERVFIVTGAEGQWSQPHAVTPKSQLRFSPDLTIDDHGRLILAYLGMGSSHTCLYLATETKSGTFREREISVAAEEASSPRFSHSRSNNLYWISSGAESDHILGATVDDPTARLITSCSRDTVIERFGNALFQTTSHTPLDSSNPSLSPIYQISQQPVPIDRRHTYRAFAEADHYVGFGDSIMEGDSPDNSGSEENAFYPYLRDQLTLIYGTAEVFNEGAGGDNTAPGLSRIDSVLAADMPGYICIMEGTNDITRKRDHYTAQSTKRNLMHMAEKCQQAGAVPILSTLIPRTRKDPHDPRNSLTRRWNQAITSAINTHHLANVDLFTKFINTPNWQSDLMFDRLHPNSTGYQLMGEIWLKAIQDVKGPPPPPTNP